MWNYIFQSLIECTLFFILSIVIQCVLGYAKRPKSYFLTPSRKLIGKSLARRQGLSFAKATWQNERYREQMMRLIQSQISSEARHLCSTQNPCSLRRKTTESLMTMDWEELHDELSKIAPVLFSTMRAVLQTRALSQHDQKVAVCVSVAVLLFHRNRKVSLLQRVTAMILYAGHSSKSVSLSAWYNISLYSMHSCMLLCLPLVV